MQQNGIGIGKEKHRERSVQETRAHMRQRFAAVTGDDIIRVDENELLVVEGDTHGILAVGHGPGSRGKTTGLPCGSHSTE